MNYFLENHVAQLIYKSLQFHNKHSLSEHFKKNLNKKGLKYLNLIIKYENYIKDLNLEAEYVSRLKSIIDLDQDYNLDT